MFCMIFSTQAHHYIFPIIIIENKISSNNEAFFKKIMELKKT